MQSLEDLGGVLPRQRDKVAIVGFAKPHRDRAPYDDDSWEIWGVNDGWSFVPKGRATRWFDMHSPDIYEWRMRRSQGHLDWMRQFDGQIYLHEARPDVPGSVRYPLEAVIANIRAPYLTSSIAYMQGLALLLGFKHIGIWGVDMGHDSEYADQRPCCELLLGIALARGVTIELPAETPLMKGPLYGRGYLTGQGERISQTQLERRYKLLKKREADLAVACDQIMEQRKQLEGAITTVRALFGQMPDKANELKARLDGYEAQEAQGAEAWLAHKTELDKVRGMVEETKYWIGLTPEGMPIEQVVLGLGGLNHEQQAALRDVRNTAPVQLSTRGGALV